MLFIAVDDLSCALGCYGDPLAKTPNIDRLAASGVCFLNAYNQLPLCNPTRASVMTGRRPDELGVYDLDRHFRDQLPDVVTLPQAFQRRGVFAGRVGKIYHYNVPASIGTDGFDDPPSWNQTINPKGRDKAEESLIFNAEPHRKISAALSWLAADGTDEEQTDGMIATEAIRMMEKRQSEPFFIAAGFFRPHTPYVAPKKYFDLYPLESIRLPYAPEGDRDDIPVAAFAHNCPIPNYNLDPLTLRKAIQAYYACVSFVDAQVGRMLDALDRLGVAEQTIVVLWSDHGYHLGEHNGIWQKRTLFEQSAKSPLIIRVPNAAGNGNALSPHRGVRRHLSDGRRGCWNRYAQGIGGTRSRASVGGSVGGVERRSDYSGVTSGRQAVGHAGDGMQYPYVALSIHRMGRGRSRDRVVRPSCRSIGVL